MLKIAINCVKVWWRMITKEKLDDDSVETCDLWHMPLLFVCPTINSAVQR